MKKNVTEYVLYRWRYIIGYTLAAILVTAIFVFAAFLLPDGLRAEEKATAVASGSFTYGTFNPDLVANLPYHLLQRTSFALLDVSTFTIKLPSIILGVVTIYGVFLLLRQWFKPNVAIITGIITTTIPAMIFAAQDGTPTIFMLAVSVWLLLSATHVTRRHKPELVWKLLAVVLLSLNMYIPLGIYLNLAVLTTMIFHPHIRLVMRRMNIHHILIAIGLSLIVMAPLVYSLTSKPEVGEQLLGIPENIGSLKAALVSFAALIFGSYAPGKEVVAPQLLSLGTTAVVIIGIIRFLMIKHTARSYIIWFWALTLIPLVVLNQQYVSYLLPLVVLMLAMGINTLIREWYRMFPHNPYARVVGLLPLSVIVVGLVLSGIARYEIAYNYTPSTATDFDNDTQLLPKAVAAADRVGDNTVSVVVNQPDMPYYLLLARYNGHFKPTTSLDVPTPVVVSGDYAGRSRIQKAPTEVFTSRLQERSDRFYLYTSL
ncbi:MAG TPA: glycosyltransferase family 39 protein [Patescibacteria group bacterium]|jgi:hypothetical protein|nr:glycosyltransferase family 39 protein [Patescibacteria group bacterium]